MASHDLDKVDQVRSRIDASYTEVKEALDAAEGDVLGALVHIEAERGREADRLAVAATQLLEELKEVASGGEVRSLSVKLDNLMIGRLPVSLTGIAAAVVGCAAVLLTKCSIEVERAEPSAEGQGEAGNRSLST